MFRYYLQRAQNVGTVMMIMIFGAVTALVAERLPFHTPRPVAPPPIPMPNVMERDTAIIVDQIDIYRCMEGHIHVDLLVHSPETNRFRRIRVLTRQELLLQPRPIPPTQPPEAPGCEQEQPPDIKHWLADTEPLVL